MGQSNRSS